MPGVSQRIITVPSWGTAGAGRRAVGAEPSPPLMPQAAHPQAAPLLGFDLPGFALAAPLGPGASLPPCPRAHRPHRLPALHASPGNCCFHGKCRRSAPARFLQHFAGLRCA